MDEQLVEIAVERIRPNPQQPRQTFDAAGLEELAASIREHGLIQPVTVMVESPSPAMPPSPSDRDREYVLIAGERRWRAAQLAGLATIPAVVRAGVDAATRLELALIENVQRTDLSAADEAQAYAALHDLGLSDEAIGQRVGKSRSTIANKRGLLRLPAAVLATVGPGEGQLPERAARALAPVAAIAPKEVARVAKEIVRDPDAAEYALADVLAGNAIQIDLDWDLHWLKTPVMVNDVEVRDCAGCPSFARARDERYCGNAPCFEAKRKMYTDKEVARVAKATGIPAAQPGESVTVLAIGWQEEARVQAWLKAKRKPEHLRLAARPADTHAPWSLRKVLGDAVALASTDAKCLTRSADVPAPAANESEKQTAKRLEAEAAVMAERREEKATRRKARADIDWLALHTAQAVAPQIQATGSTLAWLRAYVQDGNHFGGWPAVDDALEANEQAREKAKGAERDRLLRECILLELIGHKVAHYYGMGDWHENWGDAVDDMRGLISGSPDEEYGEAGIGLKLPKGWDEPPIHRTEASCWTCGTFAPNEHVTKRDIEEDGWAVERDGETVTRVTCGGCKGKRGRGGAKERGGEGAKERRGGGAGKKGSKR